MLSLGSRAVTCSHDRVLQATKIANNANSLFNQPITRVFCAGTRTAIFSAEKYSSVLCVDMFARSEMTSWRNRRLNENVSQSSADSSSHVLGLWIEHELTRTKCVNHLRRNRFSARSVIRPADVITLASPNRLSMSHVFWVFRTVDARTALGSFELRDQNGAIN